MMQKNIKTALDSLMLQVDALGYQLDAIGVDNQINRHTLIAAMFAGQKRLEGELDSVTARFESGKAKADALIDTAEKLVKSGVELAIFPAKYTYDRLKARS